MNRFAKIERLVYGGTTEGEREAAKRVLARLRAAGDETHVEVYITQNCYERRLLESIVERLGGEIQRLGGELAGNRLVCRNKMHYDLILSIFDRHRMHLHRALDMAMTAFIQGNALSKSIQVDTSWRHSDLMLIRQMGRSFDAKIPLARLISEYEHTDGRGDKQADD